MLRRAGRVAGVTLAIFLSSAGVLWGQATSPLAPQALQARWLEAKPKEPSKVKLEWKAPNLGLKVVNYQIFADFQTQGELGLLQPDVRVSGLSYELTMPDNTRSYLLGVRPWGVTDGKPEGGPEVAKIWVLKPGMVLPPAFLGMWHEQPGKKRVLWQWSYDKLPALKGFRLYVDGKVAAYETVLTKDLRQWTSGGLEAGEHTFELEAVPEKGPASERGNKKAWTVFK